MTATTPAALSGPARMEIVETVHLVGADPTVPADPYYRVIIGGICVDLETETHAANLRDAINAAVYAPAGPAPTPAALDAFVAELRELGSAVKAGDDVDAVIKYYAGLCLESVTAINALRVQVEALTAERDQLKRWSDPFTAPDTMIAVAEAERDATNEAFMKVCEALGIQAGPCAHLDAAAMVRDNLSNYTARASAEAALKLAVEALAEIAELCPASFHQNDDPAFVIHLAREALAAIRTHQIANPDGATIRATQGPAMEPAPVTGQSPVGAVSPSKLEAALAEAREAVADLSDDLRAITARLRQDGEWPLLIDGHAQDLGRALATLTTHGHAIEVARAALEQKL